jgi:DNA mismatch repair ATPase MutL
MIDSGFIFSLLSALITLGGLCVGFGVLKSKVDRSLEENKDQAKQFDGCATQKDLANLKERTDEDRMRNMEQHQKLFDSLGDQAKQIGELAITLRSVELSFREMKEDVRRGLKDIQDELKELRKQG